MTHKPWLAGFGSFALLGAVFFHRDSTPAGSQPIAFNHAKHISSGMSCTDCHAGVETQAKATLPALATCLTCHENPITESAEERKIGALAKLGLEPPWRPLPRVPPHVYFSHRRHVQLAGLACAACHGAMDKATTPPQRLFRPLNMDDCLQCHNEKRAGTDCNDCHR